MTIYPALSGQWQQLRLRHLIGGSQNGAWGSEPGADELNVRCIRVADFDYERLVVSDSDRTIRSISQSQFDRLRLVPGDILIEKSGGGEKTPVGRAIQFKNVDEAICSNFLARIRPSKRADNRFLLYVLTALYQSTHSHQFIKQNTGIQNLDEFALFNTRIFAPDLDRQRAIVTYLDEETARIDQLIIRKERQIALLNERAEQWVRALVTRGTLSNVPSKATGLEWLPEVPSHWLLRRAALLFKEVAEPGIENLPILSVSIHHGISDRELESEERDRKAVHIEDRTSYKRVRPGYLTYNMMRAWQGAVGVSTVDGLVSPAYVTARPVSGLHSPYVQFLLRTSIYIEEMRRRSKGIADFRSRLYWDQFRQITIVLPPNDEQQQIASQADRIIRQSKSNMEVIQKSVALLRERRATLITAAVMGKVDVQQQQIVVKTSADRTRFRVIVGAEIVRRHQGNAKFGRVKLQKQLYLAEAHAGISELQGSYLREAAGPLDRPLVEETERGMEASGFFRAGLPDIHSKSGGAVVYAPLQKAGEHREELAALLGPRTAALRRLIDLLRDFETRAVEAIATLYAVWNDKLIDGKTPDDDAIIAEVLSDWHPEKREKFKDADLRHWLDWMKRNGLVPSGKGPRTISTKPRDLFA